MLLLLWNMLQVASRSIKQLSLHPTPLSGPTPITSHFALEASPKGRDGRGIAAQCEIHILIGLLNWKVQEHSFNRCKISSGV